MPLPPMSGPQPHSLASPNERAAMEAQRDAGRQISAAEKQIEDAQRDAGTRIDQIRDTYEKRESDESIRGEEVVEKERLKGYEALRDLQRSQASEMTRVKNEGERDLSKLTTYYRDSIYGTERQGAEKLTALEKQQAHSLAYEQRTRESDVAQAQDQNLHLLEETKEANDLRLRQMQEAGKEQYDRIRTNTTTATEQAEQSFNANYAQRIAEQDQTLLSLNSRASEAIREVRRDTSEKLAAYSTRQRDPFYKLMDLDAKLHDDGDFYRLTATIPEHEQKHVSVSIKGDQMVLTGFRRNEEKLELEPGRTQGTNAFQSFLETFPIAWPVDANQLTRSFDGDQLSVSVPKKKDMAYHSPEPKNPPARARMERPKFPENLPKITRTEGEPVTPPQVQGKSKGSSTLA
jgi:HSP20 family molecular chaperone IbpA